MIQFLIGPYRSGKTGQLLKQLIEFKQDNPLDPCMVLVPSHRYGILLKAQLLELLRVQGAKGIFALEIATIYQTCRQILNAAGVSTHVIPRDLCVRAIADVLSRMHKDQQLIHLDSIHELKGTANALFRLMDEFERAALTPLAVLKAVESTAADEARHRELALIYKRYWERLDELQCFSEKRMVLACRELLSRKTVAGLRCRFLLVDGFDRVSPLQAELIAGLAGHAAETRLNFDYVLPQDRVQQNADQDEYAWKDSSYAELEKHLRVEPTTIGLPGKPSSARQSAFTTLDVFSEMQEIARRCKQAVLKDGVNPGEVLVVARDVARYSCAAQAAFTQAGLAAYVDASVDLMSAPWAKLILQLGRLSHNDFPRRAVIDALRSKYLDIERLGFDLRDIDRIERRSLEAHVIGGRPQWHRALANEEALGEKLEQFFDLVTPLSVHTRSAHCRWLEDLLDRLLVQLAKTPPRSRRQEGDALVVVGTELELKALSALRSQLRSIVSAESLFGKEKISWNVFIAELSELMESANFRSGLQSHDKIYISSAEHAPNKRFDHVFVAGMREGDFPKHTGESGFVSAEERARWAAFGVNLANPREEPGFEAALFRSLLQRARKSFCVSYPQLELDGEEVVPSFFLSDGTLSAESIERVDFAIRALSQPTSAREATGGWLWHTPSFSLDDSLKANADIAQYWQRTGATIYGAYQRHQPDGTPEFKGDLTALKEGGFLNCSTPSIWSVSSLNSYGSCPFQYWVNRVLKIEAAQEPQPGLDTMQRGLLLHRILELYYSKVKALSVPFSGEVYDSSADEAWQQALAEVEKDPEFSAGPYWQNEKNEILFRIKRFLRWDADRILKSGRLPMTFEAAFGMHDTKIPPLTIPHGDQTIAIRGKIDRIDVERSADGTIAGATVIDYKSGSRNITADDARAGANMQTPVYAMAVERCVMPGVIVDTGLYLSIGAAKPIGTLELKGGKTADVVSQVVTRIGEAVDGVNSGRYSVAPYGTACTQCDHQSVCRIADLKQTPTGESDG